METRGILDALYWRLHACYLLNDRTKSEKFLSMLVDEQINGDEDLRPQIGERNYARYLAIKKNIENGSFARLYGDGSSAIIAEASVPKEKSKDERQFHKDLMASPEALFALLDIPKDALIVHELVMDEYGRCDFVFRHGKAVTALEVKIGEAPTSVVSQIDKYRLGLELDMCMNLYDEVRAFVLARSFGPYVSAELSRVGVGMILHEGRTDELRMPNASVENVMV